MKKIMISRRWFDECLTGRHCGTIKLSSGLLVGPLVKPSGRKRTSVMCTLTEEQEAELRSLPGVTIKETE